MPPEVFFKKDKYLFRRTPLGDCFWNIWKFSPLLFCHFTNFFRSSPPKKLWKQSPRCVLQKNWTPFGKNIFRELLLELLKYFSIIFCLFSFTLAHIFGRYFSSAFYILGYYSLCNSFWLWRVYFYFLYTFPVLIFLQCNCNNNFCH